MRISSLVVNVKIYLHNTPSEFFDIQQRITWYYIAYHDNLFGEFMFLFLLRTRKVRLETKDHKEKKENQGRKECREHVALVR